MFDKLAYSVVKYRKLVIATWIALAAIAAFGAANVGGVLSGGTAGSPSSPSETVRQTLTQYFDNQPGYSFVAVARLTTGTFDDPAPRAALAEVVTALEGLPNVIGVTSILNSPLPQLINDHRQITLASVALNTRHFGEAERIVVAAREQLAGLTFPPGMRVNTTGAPAISVDINHVTERDTLRAEKIALPVIAVILVIAFGALVAAALPIAVGMLSISLSLALIFLIGSFGLDMSVFVRNVITMLGLGAGIDFSLLMVSRFREEMRNHGREPEEAARIAAAHAGRAIAFSGLVVAVGLTGLLIPDLAFVRSIGQGGVIVILATVLVSTTFLPAVLASLGKLVDAPAALSNLLGARRAGLFWARWATQIMKRPWVFLTISATFLLITSAPALGIRLGEPSANELPAGSESRIGVEDLIDMGRVGTLNSIHVLYTLPEPLWANANAQRLVNDLDRELRADPRVASLLSPAAVPAFLPSVVKQASYQSFEQAMASPLAALARATISVDGRHVLFNATPGENVDNNFGVRELLLDLEETAKTFALVNGGTIHVGGDAAVNRDFRDAIYTPFPLVIAFVVIVTYILLMFAFRSLLIPLKSILMNLLTVGAAYGVLVAIYQYGIGAALVGEPGGTGAITSVTPILLFAIVFGLAMDYEIFLLFRVQEEHLAGHSTETSVARALQHTGGVITSAALIVICVALAFLTADIIIIQQLGLGLAIAIFLDATIVRVVLVPAFMRLAGRWNWWLPAWLDRLLPRWHVHGPGPTSARRRDLIPAAQPLAAPSPGAD